VLNNVKLVIQNPVWSRPDGVFLFPKLDVKQIAQPLSALLLLGRAVQPVFRIPDDPAVKAYEKHQPGSLNTRGS